VTECTHPRRAAVPAAAPVARRRSRHSPWLVLAAVLALGSVGQTARAQLGTPNSAFIQSFTDAVGSGWRTLELNGNNTAVLTTFYQNDTRLTLQAGVWVENRHLLVVELLIENGRRDREHLVLVPAGQQLVAAGGDQSKYGSDPPQFAKAAAVTGRVTCRERIALPPTALIEIRLLDVSSPDSSSILIGREITFAAGRQVPIPFTLWYDPAAINQKN